MSKAEVLERAAALGIRFVHLLFTDILGMVKSVAIPADRLEEAFATGIRFDGSSIQGFVRVEESDMYLVPDPATFGLLPGADGGTGTGPGASPATVIPATGRLMCDVCNHDGAPFEGCPRAALKRAIARAREMGYTIQVGPEAEFFLFHRDALNRPTACTHDQAGYFDLSPLDSGEEVRRAIVAALQGCGFDIESSHHENSPGQHEIVFRHADALTTADNIVAFRVIVRAIAARHGLHATFMPKPVQGINGSGMHIHQSLFSGRRNAFHSSRSAYGLSDVALYYIGGLLDHARGYSAVVNPLVNSYKRLVPGYEAPVHLAWSERNRSPLIRVPAARSNERRVELRSPDPSCNPYLALAVIIQSGLDGIARRLAPPPPVNQNIYLMTDEQRRRLGIDPLPGTLAEALAELRRDLVVREALGEHIYHHFLEAKEIEWEIYRAHVHQWEIEQYLGKY